MPNTLSVTAVTAPQQSVAAAPASDRYLRHAFVNQYNLILLGGAVLFTLAFASVIPLAVGVAAELVWLGAAPRSPAFRRWAERRNAAARLARLDLEARATLGALDPVYHARHAGLGRQSDEIVLLLSEQLGARGPELDAVREKLAELGAVFVRFSAVHERLARFVDETSVGDIEQEILRTREQLAAERDLAVRVTVRQALTLAERRLAQWEQIGNTRRAVEVKLDTLEKSFAYVRSRAMGLASSADVVRDLDALLGQVQTVSALEAETQEATKFV
jgi:hypothetical protein